MRWSESRSSASVATARAESWPNVMSVASRSLSIVLGTPITFRPMPESLLAMVMVPSPPMAISTSSFRLRYVLRTWSDASTILMLVRSPIGKWNGSPLLEVPRIVPPWWMMPETSSGVSSRARPSTSPSKPSMMPMTVELKCAMAGFATLRITAFKPGAIAAAR